MVKLNQTYCVDIGNTVIKVAIFQSGILIQLFQLKSIDELISCSWWGTEKIIISNVSGKSIPLDRNNKNFTILSYQTALPIKINYDTPHSLGVDRIAAAVGAHSLFPKENCLIIDIGSCITYDLVVNSMFDGGFISPGIDMRFNALHNFTGNLPQLSFDPNHTDFTGKNTKQAMLGGVMLGAVHEMEGMIRHFLTQNQPLRIIFCGGHAKYFESKIKERIFVVPELIMIGLNSILEYNESAT